MNKPQVISLEVIKKSYLKHECSDEVARILSLEKEFDWKMITKLNLSLLNLVHIVGLRLVTNLECLSLSQNNIKKIENLDCLTKLEELDLSFNRITTIENLNHLTKLKVLRLSGNKISEVKNLDSNSQLHEFYINNNEITDINQIFYMKRFNYLQIMGLSNNPATSDKRELIIDNFPKLLYLDNVQVPETIKLSKKRSSIVEIKNKIEYSTSSETLGDANIIHKAFLNETDGFQFFNYLYNEDVDGEILSKWNSSVRTAFATFKEQITDSAMELYYTSLENLKVRDEMFSTFKMSHIRFERKWTYKSREVLIEFEEIKRIRLQPTEEQLVEAKKNSQESSTFENAFEDSSIELFIAIFEEEIIALKKKLHARNIYMNKSIMDMISKYTKIVEEELKVFLELLVPIFFNMRDIVYTYSEKLNENVRLAVNNPVKVIANEFINHFGNRFAINEASVKVTDRHMEMVYKREEKINSDAKKWAEKSIEDLKKSENERFWMVFEEITEYCKKLSIWLNALKQQHYDFL